VLVKEMIIEGPLPGMVQRLSGEQLALGGRASRNGGEVVRLPTTGDEAIATVDVPTDADYLLRVQACAEIAGTEPAKMQVRLDNRALEVFDVTAPAAYRPAPADKDLTDRARRALPRVYEIPARLKAGKHRISAAFINNLRLPDDPRPNFRDRNLLVHHIELVELSGDPRTLPISPPLRALFAKHEQTGSATTMPAVDARAARAILGDFALRAWRRPAQTDELNRLMKLYDLALANGESFRGSVKHAMNAVLVSPSFLFRGVISPQFAGRTPPAPQLVDDFELASRLSYFLWSTTPDDELLSLARRSELRPKLDAQLKRMLASPKANAFVDNFAGQWLQFRNLDAAHPDSKKFDTYNDRLRDAMKRETQMFFQSIVQDDRSLLDILTADYTFLNERLARHYGVAGVNGEEFRRVSLAGTQRRGVLTQGSVLTLTSNPTRTSPVKRGKWVLENVLGTPPPPPPPNIPPLESDDGKPLVGTLRQRLEQHRADVTCASCHAPMDPIGFALENFDAIGRWRVTDGEGKIDAASVLPDGTKLNGPAELATLLAKTRRNDFYRSVIEAALTFALGRGVEPFDQPAVDRIVDDLRKNDGRFSSLIAGVVHSVPFQMRRGEAGETADQTTRAEALR
jgi:hypothetical protein